MEKETTAIMDAATAISPRERPAVDVRPTSGGIREEELPKRSAGMVTRFVSTRFRRVASRSSRKRMSLPDVQEQSKTKP